MYSLILPEVPWKREWFPHIPRFPKSHWNSIENCRSFIDDIAKSSHVHSSSDWRRVSVTLIRNIGGAVFIALHAT